MSIDVLRIKKLVRSGMCASLPMNVFHHLPDASHFMKYWATLEEEGKTGLGH